MTKEQFEKQQQKIKKKLKIAYREMDGMFQEYKWKKQTRFNQMYKRKALDDNSQE